MFYMVQYLQFRYLKWKAWDKLDNTPSDFGRSDFETNPQCGGKSTVEPQGWIPSGKHTKKRWNITIAHRDINHFYGHFWIAMLNYQRVNQFIIQRIKGFLVDVFTVEPVLWKPSKTFGNPFWLKPIGQRPDIHWERPPMLWHLWTHS